jgi:uncharacterized protein YeeX (DUF496 family)
LLLPHLPKRIVSELIKLIPQIKTEKGRAAVLVGIAEYFPLEFSEDVLMLAQSMKDNELQIWVISKLVPILMRTLSLKSIGEILQIFGTTGVLSEDFQKALVESKVGILAAVVDMSCKIIDPQIRLDTLVGLFPHLLDDWQQKIIREIEKVEDEKIRAYGLVRLVPYVSEDTKIEICQKVLNTLTAMKEDILESDWFQPNPLIQLIPHLPERLLGQAHALARTRLTDSIGVQMLAELALHLSTGLRSMALLEATTLAWSIPDQKEQIKALIALAPYRSTAFIIETYKLIKKVEDERLRIDLLIRLTPFLPIEMKKEVLQQMLTRTRTIGDELEQLAAASAFFAYSPLNVLTTKSLLEVITKVSLTERRDPDYSGLCLEAIAESILYIPEELKAQFLKEILRVAKELGVEEYNHSSTRSPRMKVMTNLMSYVPDTLKMQVANEILATASMIQDRSLKTRAFLRLMPYLKSADLRQRVLQEISTNVDNEERIKLLAPYFSRESFNEALTVVQWIQNPERQAELLVALIPYLSEDNFIKAVKIAEAINHRRIRIRVLTNLIPYLPDTLAYEITYKLLDLIFSFRSESTQVRLLVALTAVLPGNIRREVLAQARVVNDKKRRALTLVALIPYFKMDLFEEVLTAIHDNKEEWEVPYMLIEMIPYLPSDSKQKIVQELFEIPYYKMDLFEKMLTAIHDNKEEWEVPYMLIEMIPYLPSDSKQIIVQELFEVIRQSKGEYFRATTITALIPHLSAQMLSQALIELRTIKDPELQAEMLIDSLPYFPMHFLPEALTTIFKLPPRDSHGRFNHLDALTMLSPQLSFWAHTHPDLAYPTWQSALRNVSTHPRPRFFLDLYGLIHFTLALAGIEREGEIADGIFQAIQEVCQWWR